MAAEAGLAKLWTVCYIEASAGSRPSKLLWFSWLHGVPRRWWVVGGGWMVDGGVTFRLTAPTGYYVHAMGVQVVGKQRDV